MWMSNWAIYAACRTADPDELFVQGAAQNRVKSLCLRCRVRTECLADALDNRVEWGVWGGMTERERRALLRRRPNVASWRQLLEEAREQHAREIPTAVAVGAGVDVGSGIELGSGMGVGAGAEVELGARLNAGVGAGVASV